jgi:hypothetical protein
VVVIVALCPFRRMRSDTDGSVTVRRLLSE